MAKKKLDRSKFSHSYYHSIELGNINCFKDDQTLNLSDDKGNYSKWTIILGDNGTGKTTLLKILDRMQPEDISIDLKPYNINTAGKSFLPKYYFSGISSEYGYNENLNREELLNVNIITEKKIERISFGEQHSKQVNLFYKEYQSNVFVLSYGASRRMSKSQNIKSSISKFSNTLFDDTIDLINAEEWFLQKEWAVLKSELSTKLQFQKEFNMVIELLIDILPDVKSIVSKTINENNSKPKIEVETSYGWVNLRDLSFGYQTLTALIVDIASNMLDRYSESESPLSEPVIILIDEIDLHLHPKWQRIVIDKLTHHFPKAQFIVTAHSPLILQVAQDKNANIVVCRKVEDRVVIDNNPESVKGWRIDQILTSDLFELESSRSPKTQESVDKYIVLKGKDKLKPAEIKELQDLIPLVKTAHPITDNLSDLDIKLQKFSEKYLK